MNPQPYTPSMRGRERRKERFIHGKHQAETNAFQQRHYRKIAKSRTRNHHVQLMLSNSCTSKIHIVAGSWLPQNYNHLTSI